MQTSIIMHNPVASAEELQNLSSFFQKLPTKREEDCTNADFLSSAGDSAQGSDVPTHQDWPIIEQLPLESKIRESTPVAQEIHHRKCEIDDIMQEFRSFNPENSSFEPSSSLSSKSQAPQKCIKKLQEQPYIPEAYEEIEAQVVYSNISSASLKNFTSLVQKTYNPYVENLQKIFLRMKEYSQNQLEGIRLYVSFLQIKMKQEIESLKAFDQLQSMLDFTQGQNQDTIYMDSFGDAFLDQFNQGNSIKKDKIKTFYRQIKSIYEQLISLSTKISQRRVRKENFIQQVILSQIDLIEQEMMDIIRCRLLNTKQKSDFHFTSSKIRSKNPLLGKDKYLQLKYLMRRERTYIDLMMDLKGKVINYMVSIFSKETLQIGQQIQQCLTAYANSYTKYCQQQSANSEYLLKVPYIGQQQSERSIQNELSELLISFVPPDTLKAPSKLIKQRPDSSDRVQCVLNEISSILQQTIFTTTIQMDNDYIIFRNEAILRTTRSILQKQEDNIEYQSRQDPKQKHRSRISSIYMLDRETTVLVILTSNHHLHLEKQDYIYTIDLHEVNIARKEREVTLSTRKRGINRILSHQSPLATLQFEHSSDIDQLMSKLVLITPCKRSK